MAYTSHGHHVSGTSTFIGHPLLMPEKVEDCGGEDECEQCQREANGMCRNIQAEATRLQSKKRIIT